MFSCSFDVVVDLPSKLTFNRSSSVIVTTFQAEAEERFNIAVTIRCENDSCDWSPIRVQVEYSRLLEQIKNAEFFFCGCCFVFFCPLVNFVFYLY